MTKIPIKELIELNQKIPRRLYKRNGIFSFQTKYLTSWCSAGFADINPVRIPAKAVRSVHLPRILDAAPSESTIDECEIPELIDVNRPSSRPSTITDYFFQSSRGSLCLTENELAIVLGRDFISLSPGYRRDQEKVDWINAQHLLVLEAIENPVGNAYFLPENDVRNVFIRASPNSRTLYKKLIASCEYCNISQKFHNKLVLAPSELENRIKIVEKERRDREI